MSDNTGNTGSELSPSDQPTNYVDIGMTWGQFGQMYKTFAEGRSVKALQELRPELAKACAAAEALRQIQAELPEELITKINKVMKEEMQKQGF